MENRISAEVSPETVVDVNKAIDGVKTALPFLKDVSKTQLEGLLVVNDRRKPFVEKALFYAGENPKIDPGSGLLEEAVKDFDLFNILNGFEKKLISLLEMVTDTKRLAGADAYEVSRFIYRKAKMELDMGEPGLQDVVDELGKLFQQGETPDPTQTPGS